MPNFEMTKEEKFYQRVLRSFRLKEADRKNAKAYLHCLKDCISWNKEKRTFDNFNAYTLAKHGCPSDNWVKKLKGKVVGARGALKKFKELFGPGEKDHIDVDKAWITIMGADGELDLFSMSVHEPWWEESSGKGDVGNLHGEIEGFKGDLRSLEIFIGSAQFCKDDKKNKKHRHNFILHCRNLYREADHSSHQVDKAVANFIKLIITYAIEEFLEKAEYYSGDWKRVHRLVESYQVMVGRLVEQEEEELGELGEQTEFILRKYLIRRRVSKVFTLNTYMSSESIVNDAFLSGSKERVAMLSFGCLIHQDTKNGKIEIEPIEPFASENKIETLLSNFKKWFESYIKDDPKVEFFFWPGCELVIPKEVKVTLGFNRAYPATFIKKKGSDKEICIEEGPWNITYVLNGEEFFRLNGKDFSTLKEDEYKLDHNADPIEYSLGASLSLDAGAGETLSATFAKEKYLSALKKYVLSESEETHIKKSSKSAATAFDNYSKIDLEVMDSYKDCEVILQWPLMAAQSDTRFSIHFDKGDFSGRDMMVFSCFA